LSKRRQNFTHEGRVGPFWGKKAARVKGERQKNIKITCTQKKTTSNEFKKEKRKKGMNKG